MTLSTRERVLAWDAGLAAARAVLRGRGLCEVLTPLRVAAPAIEPYIEPVPAPPGWLITSPEFALKRLLCRGAGPLFQLSPVFRRGEVSDRHREEFRLLEWYREPAALEPVLRDVEAVVEAVGEAVAVALGRPSRRPPVFSIHGFFDLFETTTGVRLRGDEDADALHRRVPALVPESAATGPTDPEVAALEAWSSLWSHWSDAAFDPWLRARGEVGIHLVDFPPALSAFSRIDHGPAGSVARRGETHVGGREIANAYVELRDPVEVRARLERAARLRRRIDAAPLPLDEGFLADLADRGLPECAGVAVGLDRVLLWALDAGDLDEILLLPGDADPACVPV